MKRTAPDPALPLGPQQLPPEHYDSQRYCAEELSVDLPETFGRPAQEAANAVHPVEPADPLVYVKQRTGISRWGAFFLAIFAQLLLLGLLAGLAWAFPAKTSELIDKVKQRFGLRSGPTSSQAAPPADLRRLEILALEDQAISHNDREALNTLRARVRSLDKEDPAYHAVESSLIRVWLAYEYLALRTPPVMDSRQIFPTAETEQDLPQASVIQVLRDRRQAPEKRCRAAYLLADHQSASARNALFQTIQDDPDLLVVRHAFEAFRKSTGYPGRNCFDCEELAQWWNRNRSGLLGQTGGSR